MWFFPICLSEVEMLDSDALPLQYESPCSTAPKGRRVSRVPGRWLAQFWDGMGKEGLSNSARTDALVSQEEHSLFEKTTVLALEQEGHRLLEQENHNLGSILLQDKTFPNQS